MTPVLPAINSCSSATVAGALRAAGKQRCEPDQLRQGKRRLLLLSAPADSAARLNTGLAAVHTAAVTRELNIERRFSIIVIPPSP
jgi:hypothetical protein